MSQPTETMIELDEFDFPAKDYFRVRFSRQGKTLFWFWAYLGVFWLAIALINDAWIFAFAEIVVVGVVFYALNLFISRYYAFSKENRSMLQKRKITFVGQKYHIVCEDGSESQGPMEHFLRVDLRDNYYRLWLNRLRFMPIPVSAFRSDEDRKRFEMEILGEKLKKKSFPWKAMIVFLTVSVLLIGLGCLLRDPERIEQDRLERQNRIDHYAEP